MEYPSVGVGFNSLWGLEYREGLKMKNHSAHRNFNGLDRFYKRKPLNLLFQNQGFIVFTVKSSSKHFDFAQGDIT